MNEDILEPEIRICDPHHHLWDRPAKDSRPANRYTASDLVSDVGDLRVTHTVFVECMAGYHRDGAEALRPVGETEFVVQQARECAQLGGPTIGAIVSFADLTLPAEAGGELDQVLDAHGAAGDGLFRGIRHAAGWDEDPDVPNSHTKPPQSLYADERFRAGARRLGDRGLVLEAWQYHPQIDELRELALAVPGVSIVLDHLGGPMGIGRYSDRESTFTTWSASVRALAECPNVVVKLGGLAMPRNGFGWHERSEPPSSRELAETTAPFYNHCLDAFGPSRCMFESNFPVDKISAPYLTIWNSFKRLAAGFSAEEKEALFFGTAARVYGIET